MKILEVRTLAGVDYGQGEELQPWTPELAALCEDPEGPTVETLPFVAIYQSWDGPGAWEWVVDIEYAGTVNGFYIAKMVEAFLREYTRMERPAPNAASIPVRFPDKVQFHPSAEWMKEFVNL